MKEIDKESDCASPFKENIISSLERYIESCRQEGEGKQKGRFPNLAGFCRFLGISLEGLEDMLSRLGEDYGVLEAVFEDEALNSDLSATLVSAYLKQRLGYGGREETKRSSYELPQVKLVFDHDIFEDGG